LHLTIKEVGALALSKNIFLTELREHLDNAYERLKQRYIDTSVLGVARAYEAKNIVDKELWTLFCAIVDFQVPVVKVLLPMLKGLITEMEGQGLKFIDLVYELDAAKRVLSSFKWLNRDRVGFKHRLLKLNHILCLFNSMNSVLERWGSLGNLVQVAYRKSLASGTKEPIELVVKSLAKALRSGSCPKYCENYSPENKDECKYFSRIIPNPKRNSAFKRICLFLRWMVRPYPDLGLWIFIDKTHLIASIDEGVLRTISRVFDVNIKSQSWKAALKVTEIFRSINRSDPTKYDYVFSRPAIMKYCTKDYSRSRCYCCPLNEICKSAHKPKLLTTKPPCSSKEQQILQKFTQYLQGKIQIDKILTEYQVNDHYIDAVIHQVNCRWIIVEIKTGKLEYQALGQVVLYRKLFKEVMHTKPEAIIICKTAPPKLREACEVDLGIKIVTLSEIGVN